MSKLGDGITKFIAAGEIRVHFFRKSKKIIFNAIVCKSLTSEAIGGTNFLRDNAIEQDHVRNVIYLDHRKITVLPTEKTSLMPTTPLLNKHSQVKQSKSSQILSLKTRILLTEQVITLPVTNQEGSVVAIESWDLNNNNKWPQAQMQQVVDGKIKLSNHSDQPINLGKEVKLIRIRSTEEANVKPADYYCYNPTPSLASLKQLPGNTNICSLDNVQSENVKKSINETHDRYGYVFNKDLSRL